MKNFSFCCRDKTLLMGHRTLIMGIVNVTPDSFSDGGKFLCCDKAVAHAEFLVSCGADIIDIGGESTRPFSNRVTLDEEINRIVPVIEKLSKRISVPISIDTTKADVALEAINVGASIVNDVSSLLYDHNMAKVVSKYRAGIILMHMKGIPKDMQVNPVYFDLIKEIKSFLRFSFDKAVDAGISQKSIMVDPGLGFGKTVANNFEIIKHLSDFSFLKVPILVGPSKKSFINKTLKQKSETDGVISNFIEIGTQATVAASAILGANVVRVHDVLNTRNTLNIIDALRDV